jgi:hypothetical protein
MDTKTFKYTISKKMKLIKEKGCKCNRCGLNLLETPWLADFHHTDPSFKEFTISASSAGFKKLLKEADKCELVCCVCHRNLHFNIERFNEVKTELLTELDNRFIKDRYVGTEQDKQNILELHNKGYHINKISQELFGSNVQRNLVRRTLKKLGITPNEPKSLVDEINRDELIQMLKEKKTAKEIARHYGMSKGNLFIILNKLNITEFRTNGNRPKK